jgi:hypothetical protein
MHLKNLLPFFCFAPNLFFGCVDDPCIDDPESEACAEYQAQIGDDETDDAVRPPGIEDVLIGRITLNQGAQVTLMTGEEPPVTEEEPEPESEEGNDLGMSCQNDNECSLGLCIPFVNECGEPCSESNDCGNDPNCCPITEATNCFWGVCVGGDQGGGGEGSGDSVDISAIQNRDALVRVYVAPKEEFQPRELQAVLRFDDGNEVIRQLYIEGESEDNDIESTFSFDVSGARLSSRTSFHVELRETSGGLIQRWPRESDSEIQTTSTGTLRVVLVPVRYRADGSDRLPDTSAEQVEIYRSWITAMYPVDQLELTVREPMDYDGTVQTQGWGQLLQTIQSLRSQDQPGNDVYYYGLVNPNTSMSTYCGGGCVVGLSTLGDANDPVSRVSTGVGFSGSGSADTLVHELGHAHGRAHAPCGLLGQSSDSGFPYDNARIGVYGYNLLSEEQKAPEGYADFMSYCAPIWVSDYTFAGLAGRMNYLSGQQAYIHARHNSYRVLIVEDGHNLLWGRPLRLPIPPSGGVPVDLMLLDDRGRYLRTLTTGMTLLSHLSGGFIYVPELEPEVAAIQYGQDVLALEKNQHEK